MSLMPWMEKQKKSFWIISGFLLIGIVGALDYLTGYELAFSLFYLVPIFLIAWNTNRGLGILAAAFSAIVWLTADVGAGNTYSNPIVFLWNTIVRFAFFTITAILLTIIRKTLQQERDLARTDHLTGAVNSRLFFDILSMEVDRHKRYDHPFALAYLDLDDFKVVNDTLGHSMGDQILHTVVSTMNSLVRRTDVVARLGGDEFAIYLPETDPESARNVITRVRSGLLEEMQRNNWPVTFSIGVLTCNKAPSTPDEMVRLADGIMYTVKRESKNGVKYSAYAN